MCRAWRYVIPITITLAGLIVVAIIFWALWYFLIKHYFTFPRRTPYGYNGGDNGAYGSYQVTLLPLHFLSFTRGWGRRRRRRRRRRGRARQSSASTATATSREGTAASPSPRPCPSPRRRLSPTLAFLRPAPSHIGCLRKWDLQSVPATPQGAYSTPQRPQSGDYGRSFQAPPPPQTLSLSYDREPARFTPSRGSR